MIAVDPNVSKMRLTHRSRPMAAVFRGVPVLFALFVAVTPEGRTVQGVAAQYPDGTRAVAMLPAPRGEVN